MPGPPCSSFVDLRIREQVGRLAPAEHVRSVGGYHAVRFVRLGRLVVHRATARIAVEVGEYRVLGRVAAVERVRLRVAVAAVGVWALGVDREALVAEVAELAQGVQRRRQAWLVGRQGEAVGERGRWAGEEVR